MGIFFPIFSNIPTPTQIIPIPMEICFSFPFPREFHGIPIPTGNPIPMHISTINRNSRVEFFNDSFINDFLQSVSVKELWKSVDNWLAKLLN